MPLISVSDRVDILIWTVVLTWYLWEKSGRNNRLLMRVASYSVLLSTAIHMVDAAYGFIIAVLVAIAIGYLTAPFLPNPIIRNASTRTMTPKRKRATKEISHVAD